MSVHNHDDEIIRNMNKNSKMAELLRKKVDRVKNDKIVDAVLNCDISGLSKEDALRKLNKSIEDAINKLAGDD
jgi:flagellar basal body-associated protein FliL